MRRGEIFWGSLLVVLGVLFFLKSAGYLVGDVLSWFWPLCIVALGIWVLVGGFEGRGRSSTRDEFSIPLQGAKQAHLTIEHGAGRMAIQAGARPGDFLTGITGTATNHSVHLSGDKLEARIEAGPSLVPFLGPEGGAWEYRLNPEVPTDLSIQSGASRLDLDLTDLCVTSFSFEGGASRLSVDLPGRVENSLINIKAGAAGIELRVPQGVGLRFRTISVGSLTIDESRFPRLEQGVYESAEYAVAKYHADVTVDGGATSIRVM